MQRELTDDEAELLDAVQFAKKQRKLTRLPQRGEFGRLIVEWSHTGLKIDIDHSVLIK